MSKADELRQRYATAMHAVQAGVATKMELGGDQTTTPKHLRVGINSALVDCSAVAGLLIRKGLFTEEEYLEALADAAERERDSYEAELSVRLGKPVTLV